ncbi:thiolase family protein [Egibacter rhizosphaerae]|uniref:Thiolase family protein n=1 Tax=Egibacter rhizosphaerae TaxID=1670831 RepID=A0A411YH29_9ACTN|nr:thiolase family protein [Egibacter rhizosphaerae]QBI20416.1 thiolase family protein [Egibacter rhizosphaerae]
MRVRRFDRAGITGLAELPVRVRGETRQTIELLGEAARGAVGRAGVAWEDVDGLALGGFTLGPDGAVHVATRLGLQPRWLAPQDPGGASGVAAVLAAARAVEAGDADVVLCVAGDALDGPALVDLGKRFSADTRDWLTPIGAEPANVTFALLADHYLRAHGLTRADMGVVSVLQRRHGAMNPNAVFGDPIALFDYLGAPPVATPLHLLDCVRPGSGASAVVVQKVSRRRSSRPRGVRVLAGAEAHGAAPEWPPRELGWRGFVDDLFDAAGMIHDDLDVLELYDDYPFMVLWQLEELGFCAPGGASAWLRNHDLGVAAPPALNTGGGMLACGQAGAAGGYVPVVEAARQLLGTAGTRQVPGARRGLVSGLGMVRYGAPLSVSAMMLETIP